MPTKNINFPISKSQFINFTKCSNSFYLHNQNLIEKTNTPHSGSLEWPEFINLCMSYFEHSVIIPRSLSKDSQKKETQEALENKHTIFGGYFESEEYASYIECLSPDITREGWILYDFRPVSTAKLDIIRSLYFQKRLLESLGVIISDVKLIRINSEYQMTDNLLDRDAFLITESLSEKLIKESGRFEEVWNLFLAYQTNHIFPSVDEVYPTCKSPKSCYQPDVCFQESQSYEIFDLREGHELPKKLYHMGIKTFEEIPDEELNQIQKIQKNAHVSQNTHFDSNQMSVFLEGTSETVCFLDFESINPTIPIFPNTRPFQHIPFLFSLHIWNPISDELRHFTYLHPPEEGDPREKVLKELTLLIPKNTTIFSFNDFFEKQIISDLIKIFPEHSEFWNAIHLNFKDLALPFKKFWIYSAKQKGKASLKEILPAFSETNHVGLSIREGQDANYQYLRLLKKQVTQEEKIRVLEDLVSYCKMDTFGLFVLYKMIKENLH
ncbi:DUF2779 domain-containing protein [Leptospira ognonensis]|uniref:DUF2779 domain-containing protein n=1 Tax=Leptospira ognonensis TaxID=2484945 RepID=A0A4R9JXE2_9LEPT|nr:DUF2779 domain-containing protein [Leptospira ognonensis]TGL57142.1 DUF2779 domain-containing protein [Leptospira ognonensis]